MRLTRSPKTAGESQMRYPSFHCITPFFVLGVEFLPCGLMRYCFWFSCLWSLLLGVPFNSEPTYQNVMAMWLTYYLVVHSLLLQNAIVAGSLLNGILCTAIHTVNIHICLLGYTLVDKSSSSMCEALVPDFSTFPSPHFDILYFLTITL